jgi:glutamate synthase domain-containing protein 2
MHRGGILPAKKLTPEIAETRGVPQGKDCISPPGHTAFSDARSLIQFANELREMSQKPVGMKLCIGNPIEFAEVVAAMVESKTYLDFITVDGKEGGTGAAPSEYSNAVGTPLIDGLFIVQNLLQGAGIRDKVKVIASGKVISGFGLFRALALGADLANSARGMM